MALIAACSFVRGYSFNAFSTIMARAKRRRLCRYVRSRTVCACLDIGVFKTARLIPFASYHACTRIRVTGQVQRPGRGSRSGLSVESHASA
jgi:hypothetical protein